MGLRPVHKYFLNTNESPILPYTTQEWFTTTFYVMAMSLPRGELRGM